MSPENPAPLFVPNALMPLFAGFYAWQAGGWISAIVVYLAAILLIVSLLSVAQRRNWPLRKFLRVRLACFLACMIPVAMAGAAVCGIAADTCSRLLY